MSDEILHLNSVSTLNMNDIMMFDVDDCSSMFGNYKNVVPYGSTKRQLCKKNRENRVQIRCASADRAIVLVLDTRAAKNGRSHPIGGMGLRIKFVSLAIGPASTSRPKETWKFWSKTDQYVLQKGGPATNLGRRHPEPRITCIMLKYDASWLIESHVRADLLGRDPVKKIVCGN